jgi:hypothetical protein
VRFHNSPCFHSWFSVSFLVVWVSLTEDLAELQLFLEFLPYLYAVMQIVLNKMLVVFSLVFKLGSGGCREAAAGEAGGRCSLAKKMGYPSSTCPGGVVEQAYAPYPLQLGRREGLPPVFPSGAHFYHPHTKTSFIVNSSCFTSMLSDTIPRSFLATAISNLGHWYK